MYTDIVPRTRDQAWQITVIELGGGTSLRNVVAIRSQNAGFALFMRDQHAPPDDGLPDVIAGAPWSTLRSLNTEYFQDRKAPVFGCFVVGSEGCLIRVAFASFPGGYVKLNGNTIRELQGGGTPLGAFPDGDFPEAICVLDRGAAVMFMNAGLDDLVASGRVRLSDLFAHRIDPEIIHLASSRPYPETAVIIKRIGPSPLLAKGMADASAL